MNCPAIPVIFKYLNQLINSRGKKACSKLLSLKYDCILHYSLPQKNTLVRVSFLHSFNITEISRNAAKPVN